MLEHQHDVVVLHLLVLVDDIDGLVVVGNGNVLYQSTVLGQYDAAEQFLDLGLHLIYIHVTHDDESLIVGTVPFLVVRLQEGTLEVVDNLHQTDRHAVAVLTVRIELGQVTLEHTLGSTGTQAPLLVDDATLLLNLLLFQEQTVSPVIENEQTRVDDALTCGGNVRDVINRLVN